MFFFFYLDKFKQIFDESFFLPKRWDGKDFVTELMDLFARYEDKVNSFPDDFYDGDKKELTKQIHTICDRLENCVKLYLNGFPDKAYGSMKRTMEILMGNPLKIYEKSFTELFEKSDFYNDNLNLFRVRCVDENKTYQRNDLFHTPYNLRSKVPSCRYSIAGYPCLYLGTDLELCCEEVNYNHHTKIGLASRFEIDRDIHSSGVEIQVIELSVKPQDVFENEENLGNPANKYLIQKNRRMPEAYLLWYPLIAGCSYIRVNKCDPFAAEYILPQLLMQWVRDELSPKGSRGNVMPNVSNPKLIGIRYFSCASEKASNMGVNYIFPGSGNYTEKSPFCSVLKKAFRLTKPYYINEFPDIYSCQEEMKRDSNLEKIK